MADLAIRNQTQSGERSLLIRSSQNETLAGRVWQIASLALPGSAATTRLAAARPIVDRREDGQLVVSDSVAVAQ